MSVVDTWNWDKAKPTDEEKFEMDANMKVQAALYEFESVNGVRPNRIIIGYHLIDELVNQFYYKNFTMNDLEVAAREKNCKVYCKYEGIPVKIDYNNPDILEVGYNLLDGFVYKI